MSERPGPAVAIEEALAGLSREEKALLFERLRKREKPGGRDSAIPRRRPGVGPLPLSFAQERLWFLDRLQPGDLYNVPYALSIRGNLEPAALAAALGGVVRRHEVLRTTFGERDGQPVQVIAPPGPWRLPLVDLAGLPAAQLDEELARLAAWEARRPFDLAAGPLLRTTLVRTAAAEHTLLLVLHHIVADAWSMTVLVHETAELYRAASMGQAPMLPELPIQYADFALWQRSWLQGEVLERQLAYWRSRLADAPAALDLPFDRPRPAVPSFRGAARTIALPPALAAGLRQLARDERLTLFMALLAPLQGLLARLAGVDDVVVGTTVTGRDRRELQGLIGFFINTLALRTDLSGDPDGRELLGRARQTTLDAFSHQDLPFEKVVGELSLPRDPYRPPLLRVLLQLLAHPEGGLDIPGLTLAPHGLDRETVKLDLILNVHDYPGGVLTEWLYDTDLFDASTVARLAGSFLTLLEGWVEDPARRLSDLPLLTAAQRHQLLVEWNPGPAGEPAWGCRGCLHRLFAHQAERTPDAPAVSMGGGRRTYRELDESSNRLARHLLAAGMRPGDRVALFLDRSLDMVEAIMAVLKAGAAYLPLDPAYPRERIAFALEDSGAALVLTVAARSPELPEIPENTARVLVLDRERDAIAHRSSGPVEAAADPELPAYVIYTSGSTGRPKGVVVPHGNVTRLFTATAPWFGFGPQDVWTLFHSYAFDFSVWEIWGALLHGGRLVVVPYWESRAPEAFYKLLRDERVTVLNQTPSAFRQLLWAEEAVGPHPLSPSPISHPPYPRERGDVAQAIPASPGTGALDASPLSRRGVEGRWEKGLGGEDTLSLRFVIFGGEALEPAMLRPWFDRHGDERPRLVNMYGITETTVHVTYRPLGREDRRSVVGRPIPDLTLHVLDRSLQPQPLGVAGEICVGGEGLAHGYLGRPALAAERFVPDPFGVLRGEAGARLYRSGDLARRLVDGDLEYLGRVDHQVKIRGFRIELGEIEAALTRHPAVGEAVVLARRDAGHGEDRLVAYVTAGPQPSPALPELRAFLAGSLPDYMLPAALVVLDRLPLTANGKVDRRALPAPEAVSTASREQVPPRDALGHALAGLVREVLAIPAEQETGVFDDFFELGGTSITGAIFINRLQETLEEIVQVVVIFDYPTVDALAGYVRHEHPKAVARLWPAALEPVDETKPARFRGLVRPVAHIAEDWSAIQPAGWREGEPIPLSSAQERLWFLDRLAPGSPVYNISTPLRLSGPLRVPAVAASLREILRRHMALRTRFVALGGVPHQVVDPVPEDVLPVVDLAGLPEPLREGEAQRLAAADAVRPFDLARGPMLRTLLLRLGPEEHVSLVAMHHIASDGWSMGVLIRELAVLYGALAQGRPSSLPEPAIQYADFAVWQRRWLQGERLEREIAYWREALAGAPVLDLPVDRPRPPVQTFRGAQLGFHVPAEVAAAFAAAGRRERASLFMTLLAGFAVLLSRYAGQDDVSVGSPVANRTRSEIEGLIGFFVNTLVLRTDLSGDPSFGELLGRVQRTAVGAFAHQEVPFEKIVEELQPKRDLSRSPLFQVMLTLQNASSEKLELPDLTLSPLEGGGTTVAKFDLTLALFEAPDGLAGSFEYNTDLFDAATIGRLARCFQTLLAAAAVSPEPVSELPLLSDAERRQLLERGRAESSGGIVCLHERFAQQAREAPAAPAITFAGATLSYAELNRRANRLAHALRARGIGPGDLVGLSLERSLDLVVAILGVLKSGAAYVPIDPDSPAERTAWILADSRVALLLTDSTLAEADKTADRDDDQVPWSAPEDPAYVIYTSGSTGKPKGVVVTHANVARLFASTEGWFGFGPEDVWTLFHSTAFDFSVWEIWGALLYGGRLVVVPYWVSRSPQDFYRLLVTERVTVLNQTPSAFRQLLWAEESVLDGGPPDLALRCVIFGGEALELSSLAPWFARHGDHRPELVNMYGITETTVHVTWRPLRQEDTARGSVVGRPIPDLALHVLDPKLEPQPLGVPGEICVGGGGLALGYLNRPDLTAERFVPDPFGSPGTRLYRSGDLARRLTDDLEYLGRIDQQVKIRGFRIELGEIEAALSSHPAVREAVVVAREGQLVAYVVAAPDQEEPTLEDLRSALTAHLPDYMLPSAFVLLPALPLTAHGKVDRRALPEPEWRPAQRQSVAPRTDLERLVAHLFAETLGLDRVGVHEDFFELGGSSITGAILINRLQEATGEAIPVVAIFETPTVAGLAERLSPSAVRLGDQAPPLVPVPRERDLPLSFAQQRLWFLDRMEPGSPAYNLPNAVRIRGRLDVPALGRTLQELVRRHETLRTSFALRNRQPVQVIAPDVLAGVFALPVVDLAALPEEAREAALPAEAAAEALRPFDLSRAPLLRATLLRLGDDDHALLLTMHHIVSDAWSMGVLVTEVTRLYGAFVRGEPSPLPALPVQYADFAVWQRQWLQGDVLAAQLAYWRQQLAGAPVLQLPTDRPRPAVQTWRGADFSFLLPAPLIQSLTALGHRHGRHRATLFMTLLAGAQLLLSRYSGQDDVTVGSTIANRTRPELEGLIGFFVNTLALRLDLTGDPSFADLLDRAREVTVGAYAHQDLPFEQLVAEIQPERDLGRSPLFQVLVQLQNTPAGTAEPAPGLVLEPVQKPGQTAKFDLVLNLAETAEGLWGQWKYNRDLFEEATIARLSSDLETLLAAVAAEPERRIAELPLLHGEERRQLLPQAPAAPVAAFTGATLGYAELVEPRNEVERFVAGLFAEALGLDRVGVHEDFFALGGNSITGAILINQLQETLGEIVQVVVIFDAPTVAELADYLAREHPQAAERLWGLAAVEQRGAGRVGDAQIAALRALLGGGAPLPLGVGDGGRAGEGSGEGALFVLAPPRSGTTLLRVMLGGHPALFAPPELELLSFNTLAERRAAFPGRDSFWLEGLVRAVMEIRGCGAEEAAALMEDLEREGLTTAELYGRLQSWLGGRMLVDKTPSYALDPAVLRRAEEVFDGPRYIHLMRHPLGMIHSFEEAKLDQIFFRYEHSFSRRELAELIWTVSHQNIVDLLQDVPAERQHWVHFEELVREPERVLRGICAFLGIDYHPAMAQPYEEGSARMTDGLHAASRMLGDVKFHQHQGVDARAAERWREELGEEALGEPSRQMAARLGYSLETGGKELGQIASSGWHEGAPLSFAQERLWFLSRLDPDSATYNIAAALRLRGRLDTPALEGALRQILRRHAVLRTTFDAVDGRARQNVGPVEGLDLPLVDLSALPAALREPELRRLIDEAAQLSFDLERDLLLRPLLLRLGQDEHGAVLVMHHIAADGWSMGVLIRELAALYRAFTQGQPSPLPDLPIQYADFARWQREWLKDERLDRELAFWRDALAEAPVLQLPTDRPRPPVQTFRGGRRFLLMPARIGEPLTAVGQGEGASQFMTLLAGFAALLARYAGQDDVSIGTPIAGRTRAEIEGLIGFFVNTLVLRTDLSGDPPFRTLLRRVRSAAVAAFAHQDLPFEKVVEELQPERDLSRTPLFQVMFTLQNAHSETLKLPGLTLEPLGADTGAAKFDLTLAMAQGPAGLFATFDYNLDLFDGPTIDRMAEHLAMLLEGVVAEPDRAVSELPLLTAGEQHQLLAEWPGTAPAGCSVPVDQLFREQAARTPGAVALLFGDERITYAELDERSDRLARELAAAGVGPEVRVAVALERSPALIEAFFGVLKAGGVYVPIDPSYPAERIELMLEDSGAAVVLRDPHPPSPPLPSALPIPLERGEQSRSSLELEKLFSPLPGEGSADGRGAGGEGPAYVIYTSGSTGRPKGVVALHRGLATFSLAMADALGLGPGDRFLQFASPSFDASAVQIFPTLLSGATLVLHPDPTALSPAELLVFCADQGVTVLDLPGALWRQTVQEMASGAAPHPPVRAWLTGGESLSLEALRQWAGTVDGESLFLSSYGPTEATITTTVFTLPAREVASLPAFGAPVGRPLGGAEVYLLDAALQPVPAGVAGGLYIGGSGLARGYLDRPELTAAAFVPHPLAGGEPGARLYRTGDLARWRPDGSLEFLGRADQQVKIRGFRVEPGEIEAILARHPAVADVAVGVHEDRGDRNDQRLVAWVVPAEAGDALVPKLRAFLRERLPEHMVPSDFVPLAAMPLTPGGKVDRRALPAPDRSRPEDGAGFVAPRGAVEETLAAVWSRLLGVERVGADDDFFELGGHSLLATQLVSRLREVFGVELPLRQVFEASRLARLAAVVEDARRDQRGMAVPPLQPLPRTEDEPLPLSFAQERLWFLDQLQPGRPTYNMPTAVRLGGPLDAIALAAALGEVRRRHEALRTRFPVQSGAPAQVIAEPDPFSLPRVDLSRLEGPVREAEATRLAVAESSRPFDLAAGPLLRATLVRLAEREHVLLITLHHIVSDGWSMGILIEELGRSYHAFAAGTGPDLPALPVQYADHARWQRGWLRGEALAVQLGYWRDKLGGEPVSLELPLDRTRPSGDVFRGARQTVHVPLAALKALEALGRREEATPFMALVAAFEALLHRVTGQTDISVGTPIAGRTRSETEGLIGLFLNTLVLRDDLSRDPTFRELIGRVRRTALDAYSHQDLPFEKIVEELQPQRSFGQTPFFQAMFVLQNTPAGALEAGELTLAPVPAYNETARFDLTMSVSQTPAGLYGWLEHKPDLLHATTVQRWIEGFRRIVEAVAADPDLRLSELPLLSAAERHQVVSEWNDSEAPSRDVCLHDLFAEQVARTPGAVAVMGLDVDLTYAELAARAEDLAGRLRAQGIRPGDRVAILMQPSPDRVAAVLAVLQAGAAYVPLDPAYPQERLDFMVQDAGASVVLTDPHPRPLSHPHSLPPGEGRIAVRRLLSSSPGGSGVRMGEGSGVRAYVIYTSGSTGQPKGVMIEHRQAVNTILDINRRFGVGERDRVFAISALSFDLSVWDLFGTLAGGGTIVLPPPQTEGPDPAAWVERLAACGVTIWNSAPPLLEMLVESGARLPATLRLAMLSGDWIPVSLPGRVRRQVPECRVISLGGATEGSIWSILHPVQEEDARRRSIPYGRPMENQRFHVFDGRGRPVPIGVVGELCIGGAGVAGGYLGRRELTAERFAPDPFGEPGTRLYRTGDLGRFLPDGTIEFLGRLDHQVKIRGFRVELGEIETVLAQHPTVREAVALVRAEGASPAAGGDRRLVGYVVPQQEAVVDPAELRAWLAVRLPEYMVPPQIVVLDRLPVTPNGKLDRAALPAPEALAREVVPPRDAVEETLAGIWRRLLGVEVVSIDDNFFELGGHSLLATRVLAALREELGVELPVREVFDRPTIAGLALAVAERRVEAVPEEDLAHMLDDLDGLSDEEIERLLAEPEEATIAGGEPP